MHVDEDLLVLDKPAGLLSVPGRGPDKQDCLAARVQQHYPEARIVHRLDMATSGLIAMARNAEAQRTLGRAFEERAVHKRYVAVVDGLLAPCAGEWGLIDLPLRMLVPCLAALALFACIQLFITRTFTGRAIMAVSQDQLALQLMAADPIKIKRIAFGLSIATAAVAGALLIIIQPVEPSVGREYIGRVFAICVLGGLGSLPGTVIGAMVLGIMESITATFYGPSWAPAVAFGFLLLTLAFRPQGILGR